MSNLQTLQQQLLQAVLADRPPRLPELRADARADAASRLAIYRNGYRVRLREALVTEFPGLALMAGRRFGRLLESYVEAHPSGHYNIRWHGAGLAAFLECALPWRDKPELAEMARLEWAISTAFDVADEPVLGATDLAGVPADAWADLRLHPQVHLHLLSIRYNVEAFRRAADRGDPRPRRRCHDRARHMLVWRQSLTVRYRQIEADECSALTGAVNGEPFASLCERLADHHDPASAMPRMANLLQQWLGSGLIGSFSSP
ncbi:MAG TPA: DNA-binding domain-containing protein [Rhodanobacter sp.]|jgi:hypothetical protein